MSPSQSNAKIKDRAAMNLAPGHIEGLANRLRT